jgi:hypothetical protein
MLALWAPVFVGENIKPTLQLLPAVIAFTPNTQAVPLVGAPNVNCVGLVPFKLTLVILSVAVPLLVMVTFVVAVLVPVRWFPNAILAGANVMPGVVPVPFSVTDCVPGVALSLTCSIAVRGPVPTGLNVTPMTQVPFVAATTNPFVQFVPVAATIVKSLAFVPEMVTALEAASVTDAPPVLLKVTVVVALVVLIRWLPKDTGEGDNVTFAAVPVPVSETICCVPAVPPESSVMVSVAERAPVATGVNVRVTTQEPFCP